MKKHIPVALASVVVTVLCCQTAPAQSPGGPGKMKPNKAKTTPSSAGATQPARSGTRAPQAPTKGTAPGFKEVTKEKFREIYFRRGGGKSSGWTADYWQKFFEDEVKPGWKFMVEEPRSAGHVRMNIVTDHKAKEYRLFFTTDEDEEDSSDWPGER